MLAAIGPTVDIDLLVLIALAYVMGSIPFGLIVGKANGIDVRTAGSGNIGATNVGRLLGRRFFFLVFFLDGLKGLLPMLAAGALTAGTTRDTHVYWLWLLVAFAAIVGHMFSCFIGFKGGKGVATSAGVLLGLWPDYTWPSVVALGVFVLLLKTTRYVSVGSIGAAVAFPIVYCCLGLTLKHDLLGPRLPLTLFSFLVPVMIVYKHRANIARLRAGTETSSRPR